jgi:hypothetical protein
MPLKGSCACSGIKFSIPEQPKTYHACHCATCKAWSGGILLSVEAGKNPTIDDPDQNLTVWKSSAWAERAFCKTCGSSLYYKLAIPGPLDGMHFFCPGGLEDWKGMTLGKENFADCRPPGICFETGPNHIAFTKAQIEAQFAGGGSDEKPSDSKRSKVE